MRRPDRRRAAGAGAAVAAAVLAVTSGCGGSAPAVTVGAALPAGQQLAVRTPVTPGPRLRVGPGRLHVRVREGGYVLRVHLLPNRATRPNLVVVRLTRGGRPVAASAVHLTAGMLTMDMGTATYRLTGTAGTYRVRTPAWQMAGRWRLALSATPPGHRPIGVRLDDLIVR